VQGEVLNNRANMNSDQEIFIRTLCEDFYPLHIGYKISDALGFFIAEIVHKTFDISKAFGHDNSHISRPPYGPPDINWLTSREMQIFWRNYRYSNTIPGYAIKRIADYNQKEFETIIGKDNNSGKIKGK
jgi:hypothetical protein